MVEALGITEDQAAALEALGIERPADPGARESYGEAVFEILTREQQEAVVVHRALVVQRFRRSAPAGDGAGPRRGGRGEGRFGPGVRGGSTA